MQLTKRLWMSAVLTSILLMACGGSEDPSSPSSGGGATGCTTLTFVNTGNNAPAGTSPHASGEKACFLASETQLAFGSKTLSSPTRGADIGSPVQYRQYAFVDGSVKYNVIFQGASGTTIYEINVNSLNNSVFYGNFE